MQVDLNSFGNPVDAFIHMTGVSCANDVAQVLDRFDNVWRYYADQWPDVHGGQQGMWLAAQGALERFKTQEQGQRSKEGTAGHVGNKSSRWRAICTLPDYCKVGDCVVGFDSSSPLQNNITNSPDVKAQSAAQPVYKVDDTFQGIEGDGGAHIVSGTSLGSGYTRILTGQDNVKVNGKPLARDGSLCRLNCDREGNGGTMARLVTETKAVDSRAGYQKALDEAGLVVDETVRSVKDTGKLVWDALGTSEEAQAAQAKIMEGAVDTVKGMWQLVRHPIDTGGAIIDSIQETDAEVHARSGNWGRVGYWLTAIAREVVGGKGSRALTGAATEAAQVAGAVRKLEKATDEAAKLAAAAQKHLNRAADLERQIEVAKLQAKSAEDIRKLELQRQRELEKAREANEKEKGVHVKKPDRLLPNHEYKINGYTYKTDAQGRVVSVEGELKPKYRDADGNALSNRNTAAQRNIGVGDGRLSTDHGGHIIGDQFDGTGGRVNLVPMDAKVNGPGGKWAKMEQEWARHLKQGDTVKVKIELVYADDTMRPSGFNIEQSINGNGSDRFIPNGN